MNDLTKLNKDARKRKEAYKPPPINKCQYMGCPMNASIKDTDGYKCAFHRTGDYHYEITESIKKNLKFISQYTKMINFTTDDWNEQDMWLRTTPNCPMLEGELHSLYINRFYNWLDEKIKNEAMDFINNKEIYSELGQLPGEKE